MFFRFGEISCEKTLGKADNVHGVVVSLLKTIHNLTDIVFILTGGTLSLVMCNFHGVVGVILRLNLVMSDMEYTIIERPGDKVCGP